MNEIKLRLDKANLADMIKYAHDKRTWGQKHVYATSGEHTIFIQVVSINFKGATNYEIRTTWQRLNDTQYSDYNSQWYYPEHSEDNLASLIRKINRGILCDLDSNLERYCSDLAVESEAYDTIFNRWQTAISEMNDKYEIIYEDDENKDIILAALEENMRDQCGEELSEYEQAFIERVKDQHKTQDHKNYEELLKP